MLGCAVGALSGVRGNKFNNDEFFCYVRLYQHSQQSAMWKLNKLRNSQALRLLMFNISLLNILKIEIFPHPTPRAVWSAV